ncbi:MAG TPA: PEP-CTERM sorting domain-containing protein [Rhizomicrobium sp.]|nr:PEP-CTERM sorting domain-containing protein [Rhizomicrobium sp.]
MGWVQHRDAVRILRRRAPSRAMGAILALGLTLAGVAGAQAAPVFGSFGNAVWGGINDAQCASPVGTFNFTNGGNCFFSQSNAVIAISDAGTGASATAFADLSKGQVSVNLSGSGFTQGLGYGGTYAHALIWDTLIFSGAAPGATVTVTISGNSALSGDARIDAVAVLFDLANVGTIGTPPSLLEGNFNDPVGPGPYSESMTFGITNNVPMLLAIGVSASTGNSFDPGSAFIDDPFSLDLPQGVTFTSASESFPTQVPEPGTWTLVLIGLGAIGFVLRHKRRRQAIAVA